MANYILILILGIQIGYWAKEVYAKLKKIQAKQIEQREYGKAGIVRARAETIPQVDLTSPSGGVRRPSPDGYILANMKERDEKLKHM